MITASALHRITSLCTASECGCFLARLTFAFFSLSLLSSLSPSLGCVIINAKQTPLLLVRFAIYCHRLEKDRQQAKQEADDVKASLDHLTKDKVIHLATLVLFYSTLLSLALMQETRNKMDENYSSQRIFHGSSWKMLNASVSTRSYRCRCCYCCCCCSCCLCTHEFVR